MVKREKSFTVPLTEEELQKIRDNADSVGMSVSSYFRFVAMKGI